MKTISKALISALVLVGMYSCKESKETLNPLDKTTDTQGSFHDVNYSYDSVFIQKAKDYYLSSQSTKNARVESNSSTDNFEMILWNKTVSFSQKIINRKAISTPIVSIVDKKNVKNLFLLSFQDKDKIEAIKVEVIRSNSGKDKFSGVIKVYTIKNKLLQTDIFEKGKVKSKSGTRSSYEQRIVSYEYYEAEGFFSISYFGGGDDGGGNYSETNPNPYDDAGPSTANVGGGGSNMTFVGFLNSIQIFPSEVEQRVMQKFPYVYKKLLNSLQETGQLPLESTAFVLSVPDQQAYPRFTQLVKGLATFVEQHERVKQALLRHTTLPWDELKVLLSWGSGPRIVVMDVRSYFGNPKLYGHTTNPGVPEGYIQIQDSFVRGLEAANLNSTKEVTAFLLGMTCLHELVHFGAVEAGLNEKRLGQELGDNFEREVIGVTVNKANAQAAYIKFEKEN